MLFEEIDISFNIHNQTITVINKREKTQTTYTLEQLEDMSSDVNDPLLQYVKFWYREKSFLKINLLNV